MSNTEKRNDEIIAETMQEFYDSIEASRRMKEQQKKEDELAALQAELDEDEVDPYPRAACHHDPQRDQRGTAQGTLVRRISISKRK